MPEEPVGFNIDAFRAAIARRGVQKPNKFQVYFPLPLGMLGHDFTQWFDTTARELIMWADSMEVPEIRNQVVQFPRYGYGAQEKRPIYQSTPEVTMTVVADALGVNYWFMNQWQRIIQNYDAREGINGPSIIFAQQTPYATYEVGYKEDYATNLVVSSFKDNGDESQRFILRESWPIAVGSQRYAWGENGKVLVFPVTFHVMDMYIDSNDLNNTYQAPPGPIQDASVRPDLSAQPIQFAQQTIQTTDIRRLS